LQRWLTGFSGALLKLDMEAALGKSWAKPPGQEKTWRCREENKQGKGRSYLAIDGYVSTMRLS